MTMEVLSRNQFPVQFEVIGSSAKDGDWTSPMTLPASHRLQPQPQPQAIQLHQQPQPQEQLQSQTQNNYHHHQQQQQQHHLHQHPDDSVDGSTLASRLQSELRAAKSQHLVCTEVLLPADLLNRVADEMVSMSEKEPCGIRGCTVYIEFEDEPANTRRISSIKVDDGTVSTFELYLTLKQDQSGWASILPQFLKNLTRSSTIMISPDFTIRKNKLYRSFSE